MSDLNAIRRATPPALFERGAAYARSGHVRRADGDRWIVQVPGRLEGFEVHLWADDWACSCEAEVAACAHVAAAAVAHAEGLGGIGEVPRPTYRLTRDNTGLIIERTVPTGAVRGEADADLNRLLTGWWGRKSLPRGILQAAFGALRAVPVTLDGAPIVIDAAPVYPRGLVVDNGQGFRVRVVRIAGIEEAFANGVVRMGGTLRPIGEVELDNLLRQRLVQGLDFAATESPRLVTEFLPALRRILEVDVQTTRLGEAVATPPRVVWEVVADGVRLRATPRLVYGDPPIARVDHGELILLSRKSVPVRDVPAERRLLEITPGLGVPIEREGAAAALWAAGLPGPARAAVLAAAPSFRIESGEIAPEVAVSETPEGFRVRVGAGGADADALVDAWREKQPLVRLLDGGWKRVPQAWLDRNGAVLAELLSARDPSGIVPRHAAPVLLDALDAIGIVAPAALHGLRALAGDFSAIPSVRLPDTFVGTLRPYQQAGVDWIMWLASVGMGGVLADDMGLGKTVQCLAALAAADAPVGSTRTLIVAPTSVLSNWEAEARRFVPSMRVCVYHGLRRTLDDAPLVITSYAILRLDLDILQGVPWHRVVLDEAQAIKNPESQAAVAARALAATHRLCLTGTPVENRLDELWSAFHFVSPGLLGGRREFRDRFGIPIENGDRRAQQGLRKRIRPFMLRRMKTEVAKDLPPRTSVVVRCTLSPRERELYASVRTLARADARKLLEGGRQLQLLEVLLRMRQAACHPGLLPGGFAASSAKLDLLCESLEEIIAEGHKALVFSQWTSMLDLIGPALTARGWEFARLDGSTVDRPAVVARFSSPEGPPIFLLSLKAGGTGLNLTAADYVFHLDPWWNPAVEDQATDRAHRIGQDKPVVSVRIIAEDTVEEKILALQERKREVARAALDEEALARGLTRDELLELFD